MGVAAELQELAASYTNVTWIDEIPWHLTGGILSPLAMPHTTKDIDRKKVRKALAASKGMLARWTDDWNGGQSEWWWICCDDREYDVERIASAHARRDIRKGLRSCSVRRIAREDFADLSYEIYVREQETYGLLGTGIPTREQYQNEITLRSKYRGVEYWGAFVDDRLAAFTRCTVVNDVAQISNAKSDVELHRFCPNNALFYTITRHYLRERGLLYVTNGSRTLLHPTTINDFLMRMGFRVLFCRLNVELSLLAKAVSLSKVGRWGRSLGIPTVAPSRWRFIEGFQKIVEIARSF